MSYRPAPQPARPAPAGRPDPLFTAGPRLGWVFRDRRELAVPYPEPGPSQNDFRAHAAARAAAADRALARAWRWAGWWSTGLAVILALATSCSAGGWAGPDGKVNAITIIVLCGPGMAWTAWCWVQRNQARALAGGQDYQQALAAWGQRAAQHETAEQARLAGQPEWGSVTIPASRTDAFGGTLAGWQALLTLHGASLLAGQPLLAIDLIGQHATSMLTTAATTGQVETVTYHLPQDLARCGLLAGLSPAQLADAIAEAIHAGNPASTRTDRAIDVQVLHQLASALAPGAVTPRRLAATTRTALGHPVPDGLLTPPQHELLAGNLFPQEYRQAIIASLVRLDAVLAALAAHGGDGWPTRPARCTCLTLDTTAPAASEEILRSLIVAWLTVHVTTSTGQAPAVIIAGADGITRPHLERLADACERRGVPLTLIFGESEDGEWAVHGACGPSGCLGDVGASGQAERADGEVAEGGHDPGAGAGPDLGFVFLVEGVADPV
jgi:hypothetical protein